MKKVIIFSSTGGGGHVSVAHAITSYIEDRYNVKTIYIFDEVLGVIDPIKFLTLGFCNAEKFYNALLRGCWMRLLNLLYSCARIFLPIVYGLITKKVDQFLQENKPDMVISVVPLVNNVLKNCCNDRNLPFLLVPTDLDVSTFVYNILAPVSQTLHVSLPFDDSLIWEKLEDVDIPYYQISVSGFPVRKPFLTKKDTAHLKKDFSIPEDTKIIMVLMGAAGSKITLAYIETLARSALTLHIMVCLGRNEGLRKKIEKVLVPFHISLTIIGPTDRIADLMAISDLLITKPGTVSVAEGIYMNIPMIVDGTAVPLKWENFNKNFIEHHQFGLVNKNFKELNNQVKMILFNTTYYNFLKNNLVYYHKPLFEDSINELLNNMINFNA